MDRKRIVIFAPETKDQEGIGVRVLENLSEVLSMYPGEINVQKFSSIGQSLEKGDRIGSGNEILVVFDRYLQLRDKRRYDPFNPSSPAERLYNRSLEAEVIILQNICNQEGIPYITYEGEIERGKEGRFRDKLDVVKPEVLARLMNGDSSSDFF